MKRFISQHLATLLCTFSFFVAGIIYCQTVTKIYVSKSNVAFFRHKIENPDAYSEESRNRWIWIRDGLNIKSALITDTMLENVMSYNANVKKITTDLPNETSKKDFLKSLINIQFTGADENNFIVEVKAPGPVLAMDLNMMVFNRIKYLALEADQLNFKLILNELSKKQLTYTYDPDSYEFYKDKIRKMVFTNTLEQKQRESAFSVISAPSFNNVPIWPNYKLIILISTFLGFVTGICLEYLLKNYEIEK